LVRVWVGLLVASVLACRSSEPAEVASHSVASEPIESTPLEPEPGEIFEGSADAALELLRERILAHSGLRPGMVVAEIGANEGWFVDRGALAIGPTGTLYATDIDEGAIRSLEILAGQANPARARVVVRHCEGERDTGLADLPDDHVDVIWMIDSVCFEPLDSHAADIAYLREFLRILKPEGRLIHHMDCGCRTSPQAVIELFEAAGFTRVDAAPTIPQPPPGRTDWHCTTPEQRRLHHFVGVFR
jgi:SAM-dependent methyltransferase